MIKESRITRGGEQISLKLVKAMIHVQSKLCDNNYKQRSNLLVDGTSLKPMTDWSAPLPKEKA